MLGQGRAQERILVALHKRVDLIVEIPAFIAVPVTGAAMLATANPDPLLTSKIAFGLLAITTNGYCVWLVFRRARACQSDQQAEFTRLDHLQHKLGALVLFAMVAELAIEIYRRARRMTLRLARQTGLVTPVRARPG